MLKYSRILLFFSSIFSLNAMEEYRIYDSSILSSTSEVSEKVQSPIPSVTAGGSKNVQQPILSSTSEKGENVQTSIPSSTSEEGESVQPFIPSVAFGVSENVQSFPLGIFSPFSAPEDEKWRFFKDINFPKGLKIFVSNLGRRQFLERASTFLESFAHDLYPYLYEQLENYKLWIRGGDESEAVGIMFDALYMLNSYFGTVSNFPALTFLYFILTSDSSSDDIYMPEEEVLLWYDDVSRLSEVKEKEAMIRKFLGGYSRNLFVSLFHDLIHCSFDSKTSLKNIYPMVNGFNNIFSVCNRIGPRFALRAFFLKINVDLWPSEIAFCDSLECTDCMPRLALYRFFKKGGAFLRYICKDDGEKVNEKINSQISELLFLYALKHGVWRFDFNFEELFRKPLELTVCLALPCFIPYSNLVLKIDEKTYVPDDFFYGEEVGARKIGKYENLMLYSFNRIYWDNTKGRYALERDLSLSYCGDAYLVEEISLFKNFSDVPEYLKNHILAFTPNVYKRCRAVLGALQASMSSVLRIDFTSYIEAVNDCVNKDSASRKAMFFELLNVIRDFIRKNVNETDKTYFLKGSLDEDFNTRVREAFLKRDKRMTFSGHAYWQRMKGCMFAYDKCVLELLFDDLIFDAFNKGANYKAKISSFSRLLKIFQKRYLLPFDYLYFWSAMNFSELGGKACKNLDTHLGLMEELKAYMLFRNDRNYRIEKMEERVNCFKSSEHLKAKGKNPKKNAIKLMRLAHLKSYGFCSFDEKFCERLVERVDKAKSLRHFLAVKDDALSGDVAGIGVLEYASNVDGKECLVEDPQVASVIMAFLYQTLIKDSDCTLNFCNDDYFREILKFSVAPRKMIATASFKDCCITCSKVRYYPIRMVNYFSLETQKYIMNKYPNAKPLAGTIRVKDGVPIAHVLQVDNESVLNLNFNGSFFYDGDKLKMDSEFFFCLGTPKINNRYADIIFDLG